MNGLIGDIDLALLANNGGGGAEWKKENCQCDVSVGMAPCRYCAIHSPLMRCKKLLEDSSRDELLATLREYLSMASIDGKGERQMLRAKMESLLGMKPVFTREVEMEYYEYDCGHPCTEDGCPGHITDMPVSITVDGVRLSVDGADAGDFPSDDRAHNQTVREVMEKMAALLNNKVSGV